MKKVLYVLLLALTLFIVGCNKEKKREDSLNLSTDVSIITINKDVDSLSSIIKKYNELTIKEDSKIKPIIKGLNNLSVKLLETDLLTSESNLYRLEFSGKTLDIKQNKELIISDVTTKEITKYSYTGSIEFLENLEFTLNPAFKVNYIKDLDLIQKITIKSNEKDATIEVTGKEEYIKKLEEISYVLYDNKKEEKIQYVIMIGENKIEVVDYNTIYINGAKAVIYESSLSFLEKIDFENTGWLPWV